MEMAMTGIVVEMAAITITIRVALPNVVITTRGPNIGLGIDDPTSRRPLHGVHRISDIPNGKRHQNVTPLHHQSHTEGIAIIEDGDVVEDGTITEDATFRIMDGITILSEDKTLETMVRIGDLIAMHHRAVAVKRVTIRIMAVITAMAATGIVTVLLMATEMAMEIRLVIIDRDSH